MSALGSLVVKLALEYAEYTRGLDKSDQAALKFAKNVQKNFGDAKQATGEFFVGLASGALAAGTAVLGVRAILDRLGNSINMLAALDDAAQKTGSSVENLSRIQRVAREFDHDFSVIDAALGKLSKGMATFDSKTNMTARALKTLGIESRDAAGKLRDPSLMMVEIAQRLQDFEDGPAKAALVMDLFGKSGVELLPVLNDVADHVHRFGAVSSAAAAEAAQLQDQVGAINSRMDDAAMRFTSGLLPSLLRITGALGDTTEGLDHFQLAGRRVGEMLEGLLEFGSKTWTVFGSLGDLLGARANQLKALVQGDFTAISQLEKDLDNRLGIRRREHEHYVATITGGNTKIAESVGKVRQQLDYQTGTRETDEAAKKIKSLNDASQKYLETLQAETLGIGQSAIAIKLMAVARQAAVTPSRELAAAILAEGDAWAARTRAFEKDERSMARLKERQTAYYGAAASVTAYSDATDLANESVRFELSLIGQSVEAREVAIRQRQVDLELRRQILAITEKVANADDRASLIDEAHAIADRAREAAKLEALARVTAAEWSSMWSTVEQTGKMAFVQLLGHGTTAMESIGKAIKASVIDLLYQLTARKWIISIGASIQASMMGGVANAAGTAVSAGSGGLGAINLLSGASSLYSALSGGLVSGLSSAVSSLGGIFGSSAMAYFGAGMGMSTATAGAAAGGLAAGGMAGAGSALSMGATMGAIAGPLAVAAIADFGLRMLAGDKLVGGGVGKVLNYVPVVGPLINALFGAGPKKLGPAELTGRFTEEGFAGQFEADWTRKVGLFGGKKRGRRALGITDEQDDLLDDLVGGLIGQFNDFIGAVGDSERSLSGWSFAVKRQVETEEQQAQLTLDLANSIGAKLLPELSALQAKGESFVETLGRMKAQFELTEALIDLTGQSFGALGIASLAARDALVQQLGGLQGASGLLQPFFEDFYSEAERAASTQRLLNVELGKLGIDILPTTREQFRALVEAQDLATDSGRAMFAALLSVAPAFASVSDAIGKAADDAAAEAKRVADSFRLLETDAFATLFEYTRYMRMAANAGVTAALPAGPVFQAPPPVYMPGFAAGTNEVPADMTARIHRGERIIPAADNRELMRRLAEPNEGMRAMAEEIKRLREDLRAANYALAANTRAAARSAARAVDLQERWDSDGMPPDRSA